MKKLLFIFAALALPLLADLEITPFGGIQWNGYVEFREGTLDADHKGNFGIFLNYDLPASGSQLELSYTANPTSAHWKPFTGYGILYPAADADLFIHSWQLGGLKMFGPEDLQVKPYAQASLGVSYFSFDNDANDAATLFSFTLGVGVKVFITDRIGLRLGSRFMVPVNFEGVGFYFGTGGGGASAYGNVPLLQGDLYGGLIIRLGGGAKQKKSVSVQQKNQEAEPPAQQTTPNDVLIIQE